MHTKNKQKRLLIVFFLMMALLMSITIFLPSTSHKTARAENTYFGAVQASTDENGVYLLSQPEHLEWFARFVNEGGDNLYAAAKLTQNIDFAGNAMTPIGNTVSTSFRGVFDGNNFSVKNMTATYTQLSDAGFFGIVGHGLSDDVSKQTIIKNLKLENINVTHTSVYNIGALAGAALSNVYIENCDVDSDSHVESFSASAGGLIGGVYSSNGITILKSNSKANIFSQNSIANIGIGGVLGFIDNNSYGELNIIDCSFGGSIEIGQNATQEGVRFGGIIGFAKIGTANDVTVNIEGCTNSADIVLKKEEGGYIGGIIGEFNLAGEAGKKSLNILDCINYGNILPDTKPAATSYIQRLAGIIASYFSEVGGIEKESVLTIKNCENWGTIGDIAQAYNGSGDRVSGIAAFIRFYSNNATLDIDSSRNYGNVYGSSYTSGIAGDIFRTAVAYPSVLFNYWSIKNCVNYGAITAIGSIVAGIVSIININNGSVGAAGLYNWDRTMLVENCHNYGRVSGLATVSGIVAQYYGGNGTTSVTDFFSYKELFQIKNCSNSGDIAVQGARAAGILSYGLLGTLSHAGINASNLASVSRKTIISNNFNTGYIYSTNIDSGGIVGVFNGISGTAEVEINGGALEIQVNNNWNTGDVICSSRSAGGILGTADLNFFGDSSYSNIKFSITISDNFNTAKNILARGSGGGSEGAGGIIGTFFPRGHLATSAKKFYFIERNYSTTTNINSNTNIPYNSTYYDTDSSGGIIGGLATDSTNNQYAADRFVIKNNYTTFRNILGGARKTISVPNIESSTFNISLASITGNNALSNMAGLNTGAGVGVFKNMAGKTPQFADSNMPYSYSLGTKDDIAGEYSNPDVLPQQNVILNLEGGTLMSAEEQPRDRNVTKATFGKALTLPIPTRDGHEFEGWFSATVGGDKYPLTSMFLGSNTVTLYARWRKICTITFDSFGGSHVNQHIALAYKDTLPQLPTPATNKPNFTFDGWSYNLKPYKMGDVFDIDDSISLVARWKTTISLNYNGVAGQGQPATIDVWYNEPISMPNPTNSQATLHSWLLDDGTTFNTNNPYLEPDAISLTARWLVEITYI